MRYFTRAVALGSIARAANELNVAASAVSAAIDQIEAQFEITLVNRFRSKGIVATANGRVLEQKFLRLLEEYDTVMLEGSDLKHSLTGDLRIGYYAPVAPAFLPRILEGLAGRDGAVTLHMEECDNDRAQEGLLSGGFDVILFVSNVMRPQVEFDVLIDAPAYCLLSAGNPLARSDVVRLADLACEPIVVLNRPIASDYYRRLFDEAGQSPMRLVYANSTEMVRGMVGAGYGSAVLNMLPATDLSYAGQRLVARPIADPLPPLTLSIGYDRTRPRRLVQQFVSQCKAYFRGRGGALHIVTETGRD
ncbi:LysR substrate-binding domain-containing protein [Ovoidimarina sediminis]|uniref:LysR substrate-binding domain-containing protein n=1 Tax=Ovoidimarina sediminis TaxID=3079856 RepID=UPI00292D61A6|nr:LysR substrate-binding domain-containing protein [Rhodophyticola sp. MJ-SS7]